MSVDVVYRFTCGGCDAKYVSKSEIVNRRFESVSGRTYGFGRYVTEIPEPKPPAGWVAFDPYTGCCYCPECWAEIIKPEEAPDEDAG
jgi:hypothetical protein